MRKRNFKKFSNVFMIRLNLVDTYLSAVVQRFFMTSMLLENSLKIKYCFNPHNDHLQILI